MLAEPQKQVRIWQPLDDEREFYRDHGALAGLRIAYITNDPPKPFVIKISEEDVEDYAFKKSPSGKTPLSVVRDIMAKKTGCGVIIMACKRRVIPGHFEIYDQRGNLIRAMAF